MYCGSYIFNEIIFVIHYNMRKVLSNRRGLKRSSHKYFQYKLLFSNTIKIHRIVTRCAAGMLSTISLRVDCQTNLIRYLQAV